MPYGVTSGEGVPQGAGGYSAAVYHKKVGDFATYKVRDNTFKIEILEKNILGLEQESKTLKKTR